MELLISDLLTYSQAATGEEGAAQRVDTMEVLSKVKQSLATVIEETGAVIEASGLPVVMGDDVPLLHLFQNLISNGLKYQSEQPPRIVISAREQAGSWIFAVQDNGIGIPKEFQTQIFGIFKRLHSRRQYPGTGIGLAICQKVVERCGGQIWVESEEGQRSTFFFSIPQVGTKPL